MRMPNTGAGLTPANPVRVGRLCAERMCGVSVARTVVCELSSATRGEPICPVVCAGLARVSIANQFGLRPHLRQCVLPNDSLTEKWSRARRPTRGGS